MDFELLSDVNDIEPIAVNLSIRERKSLKSRSADAVGASFKAWRWSGFPTEKSASLNYIGTRPMVWAGARLRSNGFWIETMLTNKKRVDFAICVANEGYDDLEVWKVYQVLSDAKAPGVGCIRVMDESGEDYLYPVDRFVAVEFPKEVRHDGNRATDPARRRRRPPEPGGA